MPLNLTEFQRFNLFYRYSKWSEDRKYNIPETKLQKICRLIPGVLVGRKCFCGKPYWRILFLNEC